MQKSLHLGALSGYCNKLILVIGNEKESNLCNTAYLIHRNTCCGQVWYNFGQDDFWSDVPPQ